MEGIPVIETEWGSGLHRELIAAKARLRIEWRDSPGAIEDVRRMSEASPLSWDGVVPLRAKTHKTPIYRWTK